jgi:hypothetical protein
MKIAMAGFIGYPHNTNVQRLEDNADRNAPTKGKAFPIFVNSNGKRDNVNGISAAISLVSSHPIMCMCAIWDNGQCGQFGYFDKQNVTFYESQNCSEYNKTIRFIESTRDFSSWSYPESEWATKCPIVAEGFIVFYASNYNDDASKIYDNYYCGLRELFIEIENKKPDAYRRNLNAEFYTRHIAEEKERVNMSGALFGYLTEEQKTNIQSYINSYFEYIKREYSKGSSNNDNNNNNSQTEMENKEYKYDVAFSFAGEDRAYVEKVASIITKSVEVFYDDFEKIDLWGKDLAIHLDYVYNKSARFFIPFISKHYKDKMWTKHELKSALQRAIREKGEYILPARFDDTEIEGINTNIKYIDLRKFDEESFANTILEKLGTNDKKNHTDLIPATSKSVNQKIKEISSNTLIPMMSELNRRMNEMTTHASNLIAIPQGSQEESDAKQIAKNYIKLFDDYLNANRFYIDEQIVLYAEQIRSEVNRFMKTLNILFSRSDGEWANSVDNSIKTGVNVFDTIIPELRKKMEERQRKLTQNSV